MGDVQASISWHLLASPAVGFLFHEVEVMGLVNAHTVWGSLPDGLHHS